MEVCQVGCLWDTVQGFTKFLATEGKAVLMGNHFFPSDLWVSGILT